MPMSVVRPITSDASDDERRLAEFGLSSDLIHMAADELAQLFAEGEDNGVPGGRTVQLQKQVL